MQLICSLYGVLFGIICVFCNHGSMQEVFHCIYLSRILVGLYLY